MFMDMEATCAHSRLASKEAEPSGPKSWQAKWIGNPASADGGALYLRRAFTVDGPVKSAQVYVSGLGYYELRLNGLKVGDQVLDPAWTAYDKRVLYCVYDVGDKLLSGANVIGSIVGNGWYGMPKLRLQLEIRYQDGRSQQVVTRGGHSDAPEAWMAGPGPLRNNSIYDGEYYDATLECPGWDQPGEGEKYSLTHFAVAVEVDAPAGPMCLQSMEPIKVMSRFAPVRVTEVEPGVYVFDAGRNMAGWAEVCVEGERGQRLTLRYAETLGSDGKLHCGTLRQARATDTYILKGGDKEAWEPRFTYHGFRYVQVEGLSRPPDTGTLTFCLVRTSVERCGSFRCAHPLLERIEEMVIRTEESNLHGIPTDCPQRNERMGWLNDMTVRTEELIYHFGVERFMEKWVADIVDTQCPETGSITDTAPFAWGKRPADPVSASFLLIPWLCYVFYGNERLIRTYYIQMGRWVEFLLGQREEGVVVYSHWGDWSPPEAFAIPESVGAGAVSKDTPGPLVSTAYLHYQCVLMAKMAKVIGLDADVCRWSGLAQEVKSAFHGRFWNEHVGGYGSGNQACNSLALTMGLVPESLRERVVEGLVRDVEKHDYHLTTGNLCTKYLLEVLTENGHADIAFRTATQTSYPSWGYMLEQGATTLWERWENKTEGGMNSHNHPMLGSISAWFFKYLAGIQPDEGAPGFQRFIIRPTLIEGLDSAGASYACPHGEIRSNWTRHEGSLVLEITIPDNTQATIHVPALNVDAVIIETGNGVSDGFVRGDHADGKTIFTAPPGTYRFSSSISSSSVTTTVGP